MVAAPLYFRFGPSQLNLLLNIVLLVILNPSELNLGTPGLKMAKAMFLTGGSQSEVEASEPGNTHAVTDRRPASENESPQHAAAQLQRELGKDSGADPGLNQVEHRSIAGPGVAAKLSLYDHIDDLVKFSPEQRELVTSRVKLHLNKRAFNKEKNFLSHTVSSAKKRSTDIDTAEGKMTRFVRGEKLAMKREIRKDDLARRRGLLSGTQAEIQNLAQGEQGNSFNYRKKGAAVAKARRDDRVKIIMDQDKEIDRILKKIKDLEMQKRLSLRGASERNDDQEIEFLTDKFKDGLVKRYGKNRVLNTADQIQECDAADSKYTVQLHRGETLSSWLSKITCFRF